MKRKLVEWLADDWIYHVVSQDHTIKGTSTDDEVADIAEAHLYTAESEGVFIDRDAFHEAMLRHRDWRRDIGE